MNFNKPYRSGNEYKYIEDCLDSNHISGNGKYTKLCHSFFNEKYGFESCLLTTSCTDALEMTSILMDIKPGDEIIIPSFTFVSTANAFILRGANVVFADSRKDHPGIDENKIEALITNKTKAIIVVHYAGVAVNMEKIMNLSEKYDLFIVEDAAQAINSFYTFKDGSVKPIGSIGHFGTFSFHETKNIISGEGGLLVVNDKRYTERAEIIWEKGTNRSAFFRGQIDKYGWVDLGSSFLPSDMIAAFLYAQLEELESIQNRRTYIWNLYNNGLQEIKSKGVKLPYIPGFATNNGHMYYLICNSLEERNELISYLRENKINAVFHYQSLHKSDFYLNKSISKNLPQSDLYSNRLIRLPMFFELKNKDIYRTNEMIREFYKEI